MSLKHSYTLIAPFYDAMLSRALTGVRAQNLQHLPTGGQAVLVNGIGTGLDLPHLPPENRYVGLDLTPAMLRRATARRGALDLSLVQGNSLALPFSNERFDQVVMHLILAVVPDPAQALREAARVLKPGGGVLIFDKFLRPGQPAPLRRALNLIFRQLATRLDVVFEEVLAQTPGLRLEWDTPRLASGWFRAIKLVKS